MLKFLLLSRIVSVRMLHLQDLRVDQVKEPYIRVNIRKLNKELYIEFFVLYTLYY